MEEFPLERFVNAETLEEVLYRFENHRKLEQLKDVKKTYTLEEYIKEFPVSSPDGSGNVPSEK